MRYIALILLLAASLALGQYVDFQKWRSGETLLTFFKKNGIPQKLYYRLDPQDKELANEIHTGITYILLKDANGSLEQALIPISEELQIHIFKKDGGYRLDFIPISYTKIEDAFSLPINTSAYLEILKVTQGNRRIANEFVAAFKNSVDFTHSIQKGDRLALIYEQKIRLGDFFGMPMIKGAVVETHGIKHFVFNYKGRYYDEKGKELESFLLQKPIRHARITSRFTLRRWHPILHRYRAHLGVDFGARRGTPVMAAGSGRVVFAGRKGGYGNVVIIAHRDGYRTLYAHLSKFRRGIRRGKYVKQGQIIAYVGSTGLSTGPHLHFGLYKNGRAINPLKVVRITKSRLRGKELRQFQRVVKRYKKELEALLQKSKAPTLFTPVRKAYENLHEKGGEHGKKGVG